MLPIPWNTDAPLYHFPWMTIVLIVVNVLVFFLTGGCNPELIEDYILQFNKGLHPVQWVTAHFLHEGFMHLLGNMIFLWAFGLVVEGKLGWYRFLGIYLAVGIVQAALAQCLFFIFREGAALGASVCIYGLLGMALAWAPKNEMSCVWLTPWGARIFDISILALVGLYAGFDLLFLVLQGFAVSTEMLHLMGGTLGLAAGILLLKYKVVDCEGWDLWSVLHNRQGRLGQAAGDRASRPREGRDGGEQQAAEDEQVALGERRARQMRKLSKCLDEGRATSSLSQYKAIVDLFGACELSAAEHERLIDLVLADQLWNEGISLMEEYLRRFSEQAVAMRLRIAKIALDNLSRPRHALKVLSQLPDDLPDGLEPVRQKLMARAEAAAEEGPFELEGQSW